MSNQRIYEEFISLMHELIQDGTLPKHLKNIELKTSTRVDELGLDSISLVAVLTCLMDMTDTYLPDNLFIANPTLWEIAQRVNENIKS